MTKFRSCARIVVGVAVSLAAASCGAAETSASVSVPQEEGAKVPMVAMGSNTGHIAAGNRCDDMPTLACEDRSMIRCHAETNSWRCDKSARPGPGLACSSGGFFPCPGGQHAVCDHTVNRWVCEDLSKSGGKALPHLGVPCDHDSTLIECGEMRAAKCDRRTNTWKCVAR